MVFLRTTSGLSNYNSFYKVDLLVFVEGGSESFSFQDIKSGKTNELSVDVKFWNNTINYFGSKKKIKILAVGSKGTLTQIAQKIKSAEIINCCVAMDRDHDDMDDEFKNVGGVLYTYGYSWENDVWDKNVIEELFFTFCPLSRSDEIMPDIERLYNRFLQLIEGIVKLDVYLFRKGRGFSYFTKFYKKTIAYKRESEPKVNIKKTEEIIQNEKKKNNIKRVRVKIDSVRRSCRGHLYGKFCFWILLYLLKKYKTEIKTAEEVVSFVAIDKLFDKNLICNPSPIYLHYENLIKLSPLY